jgi:hypothetical protein
MFILIFYLQDLLEFNPIIYQYAKYITNEFIYYNHRIRWLIHLNLKFNLLI